LFQDQKFERLELRTAAGNTASQQVAQKAGCLSEGVLRSAWLVRGGEPGGDGGAVRTDLIVWSLLPEDIDGGPGRSPDDEPEHPSFVTWA
jgi:RimJ/RimL family protein N-acetyltransferase